MKFVRSFIGEDGQSYYEHIAVDLSIDLELKGIRAVRVHASDPDSPYHATTRRNLDVVVTGAIDATSSSGGDHRLRTRSLGEDLTGQGHKTRRLSWLAFVLLVDLEPDISIEAIFSSHTGHPDQ